METLGFLGISFDPTGVLTSLLGGIGNLFVSFFSYLLNEVNAFINWLVSLLPQLPAWPGPNLATIVSDILGFNLGGTLSVGYQLETWNYYICVNLDIVLFFLVLTAEGALVVWKFIRWILTHIPLIGGGE